MKRSSDVATAPSVTATHGIHLEVSPIHVMTNNGATPAPSAASFVVTPLLAVTEPHQQLPWQASRFHPSMPRQIIVPRQHLPGKLYESRGFAPQCREKFGCHVSIPRSKIPKSYGFTPGCRDKSLHFYGFTHWRREIYCQNHEILPSCREKLTKST